MAKKKSRRARVRLPRKGGPYYAQSAAQLVSPGLATAWVVANLPSADWCCLLCLTKPRGPWGVYCSTDPGHLLYSNLPRYYNQLGCTRN